MVSEYSFCTRCGAELPPGSMYCPECGKSFADGPERNVYRYSPNPLTFFLILLGAYAIISIVEGIFVTMFNDAFMSNVKIIYGTDIDKYLSEIGVDSFEQLEDIMYKEGFVTLASGILAAATFILCMKLRCWKVAVTLCLMASFILPVSLPFMPMKMIHNELITLILQVLVGLMVTRGIIRSKTAFK